jgi:hypothetical protein
VLLEHFPVRGVVVSGVAGSPYRIGDVSVPEAWALDDGSTFDVHRPWLALADGLTDPGALALERCTVVPTSGQDVCLGFDPVVVVGGVGHSSDPYNGSAYQCAPNPPTLLGREVFGCDGDDGAVVGQAAAASRAMRAATAGADAEPTSEDMETAAIGQEAARRHLPFIAFRATSDGSDDPLGLPGFPAQFFAYYRLAADNAAAAAAAFLEHLSGRRRTG